MIALEGLSSSPRSGGSRCGVFPGAVRVSQLTTSRCARTLGHGPRNLWQRVRCRLRRDRAACQCLFGRRREAFQLLLKQRQPDEIRRQQDGLAVCRLPSRRSCSTVSRYWDVGPHRRRVLKPNRDVTQMIRCLTSGKGTGAAQSLPDLGRGPNRGSGAAAPTA